MGIDIVANKVPDFECCATPHHLQSIINDPNYDFIVDDFCKRFLDALKLIIKNGCLSIIVGSNTYLAPLLEYPNIAFYSK
ncbi:Adenylate isopentenyltransferase 5 [Spatholobus suberectus]|nr:Adenylate isopentenyltransferase 5 [Spatholobus suberectus]